MISQTNSYSDKILKDNQTDILIDTKLPKIWKNKKGIKTFISHSSVHKGIATNLSNELYKLNFNCFVAHEDISPTLEWQSEIEKGLHSMDIFISLHAHGFSNSHWCQQEVGFAVSKGIKIIPIKWDEDPQGFIHKIQAISKGKLDLEGIAKKIVLAIRDDDSKKIQTLYNSKLREIVESAEFIPF